MNPSQLKRAAARAAFAELVDGAIVGVGSGSTVNLFIDELAARAAGIPVVCASESSAERARSHGMEVLDLNQVLADGRRIPAYVDGADEIDTRLRMIKGGGGALTREKIVAAASGHFVCIVDASKCVERLGRFPLPIEVIPMARELVSQRLRELGGDPVLRAGFVTDNGNQILDVTGLDFSDAVALEGEIQGWPGVVTAGLFAIRGADVAIIAAPDGVVRRTATGARG